MASGSSIRPEPGFLAETGSYKSYYTRIPAQHGGQTKGRAEPTASGDTVFCFPPAWKRPDSVWPTLPRLPGELRVPDGHPGPSDPWGWGG